jgi:hypothetical protein
LKDSSSFFKRVFAAGIDSTVLSDALPFIFGVYDPDSTEEARVALRAELAVEYDRLCKQVATVNAHQLDHHKKLASSFRVIVHDVGRTDRAHVAFKHTEGPGLEMLAALLRAYCLFNPTIGYLQGMNDLFVPIILAYFPWWDEEGHPVDCDPAAEGAAPKVVEHKPAIPLIFKCFEKMLAKTNHLELLASVTEQCQKKARVILGLIEKVSPLVAIWIRRTGLQDLLWMYSDFVLLFKRSVGAIWDIWLQFNCAPDPANWLVYFTTAILLQTFRHYSMKPDMSITVIMDVFPDLLKGLNVKDIGKLALWLHDKHPLEKPPAPAVDPNLTFEFFKPAWLTASA